MLSFLWSFILLATQHILLHIIMPSLKRTVEKVMGPSPSTRRILLQAELRRIREEGIETRAMLAQVIEDRNLREVTMRRDRQRMRMAGILGSEELEMMLVAEERLRRGGITTGRLLAPTDVPDEVEEAFGRFVEVEERAEQTETPGYGPLHMVEEDQDSYMATSCSRCMWLGFFIVVLVLAVTGLAALLGALTRPYIL